MKLALIAFLLLISASSRAQDTVMIEPDTMYAVPEYHGVWYFSGQTKIVNNTDDTLTLLEPHTIIKQGTKVMPWSSLPVALNNVTYGDPNPEQPWGFHATIYMSRDNASTGVHTNLGPDFWFINPAKSVTRTAQPLNLLFTIEDREVRLKSQDLGEASCSVYKVDGRNIYQSDRFQRGFVLPENLHGPVLVSVEQRQWRSIAMIYLR